MGAGVDGPDLAGTGEAGAFAAISLIDRAPITGADGIGIALDEDEEVLNACSVEIAGLGWR